MPLSRPRVSSASISPTLSPSSLRCLPAISRSLSARGRLQRLSGLGGLRRCHRQARVRNVGVRDLEAGLAEIDRHHLIRCCRDQTFDRFAPAAKREASEPAQARPELLWTVKLAL